MEAKLIFLEVITGDTKASRQFYGTLLGLDAFARTISDQVEAYHMPISSDGIHLHITKQPTKDSPRIVPYFAVKDLRETIEQLTRLGGQLIVKPFPVRVPERYFDRFREKAGRRLSTVDPGMAVDERLGDVALMLDPDRNPIGLMVLEEFLHYTYQWGKHRRPLREEQFEDHVATLELSSQFLLEQRDREAGKKA
jgi:predicted enzyme related to lactoylglutathione lyase